MPSVTPGSEVAAPAISLTASDGTRVTSPRRHHGVNEGRQGTRRPSSAVT